MRRLLICILIVCLGICVFARAQDHEESATPKINYPALEKLGWKLGSQAYTFRSLTLIETLDVLKRLDLHYIEMYPGQKFSKENPVKADHNSMTNEMVEQLRKKLAETNVTAIAYGVVELPADEAKSRKVFDFAKKLGLKEIVSEPPEEALAMVDKLAGEYGMKVAIHNHPKPSHYWDCHKTLAAVKDRENIGACADIGHWVRSGMSSPECIKVLEGQIVSLHVKDINEKKEDVILGTGTVDVAACLKELKRQNAKDLLFSVEYEKGSGEELVANVAKSVQFFSDQVTDLAKE